MAKTETITLTEYQASKHNTDNLVKSAITRRIREKRTLPNVKKITQIARIYLVDVPSEK